MTLEARLASIESSTDSRGHIRRKLFLEAKASIPGADATSAVIRNLSQSGLLIETTASLSDGDLIEVNLPHAGVRVASVMWNSEGLFGCKFAEELSAGTASAALLRAPFDVPRPGREAGHRPDANSERSEEQLSYRARFWINIGLALLSWLALAGVVASFLA